MSKNTCDICGFQHETAVSMCTDELYRCRACFKKNGNIDWSSHEDAYIAEQRAKEFEWAVNNMELQQHARDLLWKAGK